jgi:hypothetical protein
MSGPDTLILVLFPTQTVMPTKKMADKRVTLAKVPVSRADEVRARLAKIGIDERDVAAAVSWARENERRTPGR